MDPSVLARKQLAELKDIASHLQMRGYQRLKKAELIQAIVSTAGGDASAPSAGAAAGDTAPPSGSVAVAERPAAPEAPPEANGQLSLGGGDGDGDGDGEVRTRVRTRSRDRSGSDSERATPDATPSPSPSSDRESQPQPRRRTRRERIEARTADDAQTAGNGAAPAEPATADSGASGGDADARTGSDTAGGDGDAKARDNGEAARTDGAATQGDDAERGDGGDRGKQQERGRQGGSEQQRQGGSEQQRQGSDSRQQQRGGDDDDAGGRRRRSRRERRRNKGQGQGQQQPRFRDDDGTAEPGEVRSGVLDVLPEGYGFLRTSGYLPGDTDVYVSQSQIRKHGLRRGDIIEGPIRQQRAQEKVPALHSVSVVNSHTPAEDGSIPHRPDFKDMTPLFPDERLRLETPDGPISMRIVDLMSPIGKGQRGLVVSPPKAGKTTILKELGQAIAYNNPECHLMVVLVDERPEEVTDMQRSVPGEIIASTFDRPADDHTQIAELAMERAKRLVEQGRDVVVLLDSITRLARAYNLAAPASGRIMSGGVDSTALYPPKRFFGAARNIEAGGSLTIIATALVETGSKMDEVIFEEFKGTGNCELRLDRRLEQKRIFPALDIEASGTRKEELLLDREEIPIIWKLRRVLHALDGPAAIELLIDKMKQTRSNNQFLLQIQKSNLQG